jgi:hypothetical protein
MSPAAPPVLPLRPLRCVIGLTGAAGAGKDTCAALLAPLGFRALAFADPLRAEIQAAFGIDPSLFTDPDVKEQSIQQLAICRSADAGFVSAMFLLGHDLDAPRSPRWVMQRWGTEYRRTQDSGYWTRKLIDRVIDDRQSGFGIHVITDVRLPNEADTVNGLAGKVLRVHRPLTTRLDSDTRGHASESAYIPEHAVIHNDGNLDHLRNELLRVVPAIGVWTNLSAAAA